MVDRQAFLTLCRGAAFTSAGAHLVGTGASSICHAKGTASCHLTSARAPKAIVSP